MGKKKQKRQQQGPQGPKSAEAAASEASAKAGRAPEGASSEGEASPAPPRSGLARLSPYLLILFGAHLPYLAFVGFGIWPLAFVAFVPFLFLLESERSRGAGGKRIFLLGWLQGTIQHAGGYHWLTEMLENFSGFGTLANVGISSIFWIFQGLQMGIFAWLYLRGRARGWPILPLAVIAFSATEFIFPFLFPAVIGNSFFPVPMLIQIVDLGGPILTSMLYVALNAGIFLLLQALIRRERPAAFWPAIAAGSLLLTLGYGAVRISQIDARTQLSPKITVGLVQVNMGIFDKREDPREGQRRHIEDTIRLEAEVNPDLIIWPESAYTYFLPPDVENVRRYVTGRITTPLLFGGLQRREERHYNTAFMVDGEGDVIATYDKTHLLAFGEYLPFGETFPELYEWSPNSGHFTPGDHQRPLPFADYRISTLVCYEDVLPGFTRAAVREANPHLLVNITNDAWFGDTQEPWIHLALAQFRAVEHHRYLARATNSGVSAIIDPVGRITAQSGVFTRETVHGEVAMMTGWTLYQTLGSWPAWLAIAMLGWMAFGKRRARPAPSSTSPRSRREAPPPGDRPGA